MADTLSVQVCFATPQTLFLRAVTLPRGATVQQAIAQSGVLAAFPEIELQQHRVGIYGKLKTPETVLRAHDRVEIYRPLRADPKESRRNRVANRRKA